MSALTYFEQTVAGALAETKPQDDRWSVLALDQWRADVIAIGSKLDAERDAFRLEEWLGACGGLHRSVS